MPDVYAFCIGHPQLQDRTWHYRKSTQCWRAETRSRRCTRLLMDDELILKPAERRQTVSKALDVKIGLLRSGRAHTLAPVKQTLIWLRRVHATHSVFCQRYSMMTMKMHAGMTHGMK